ncbi:hypothetical protein HDU91_005967, partial [Kappamyces sp. JEL0680]
GYLSTVLAYQYGYHVVGIDADPRQTSRAEQRGRRIANLLQYHNQIRDGGLGRLEYITSQISIQHGMNHLFELVFSSFPELREGKWLVCGLHCCGDLSPTMIRAFCDYDRDNVKALVSLGCCYHVLTEKTLIKRYRDKIVDKFGLYAALAEDKPDALPTDAFRSAVLERDGQPGASDGTSLGLEFGYPMSTVLRDFPMGFNNRVAACQALKRWGTDKTDLSDSLKRLYYRSVLQKLMQDCGIIPPTCTQEEALATQDWGERCIKKLGAKDCANPVSYTRAALKRLGCEQDQRVSHLTDATIQATFEWYSYARSQVATVWTLRCLLSDALESLLLVDRCLAVQEAGFSVELLPICEVADSPRNMALICTKPHSQSTNSLL